MGSDTSRLSSRSSAPTQRNPSRATSRPATSSTSSTLYNYTSSEICVNRESLYPQLSLQTDDPPLQRLQAIRRRIDAELNRNPSETNMDRLEKLLATEKSLVRIHAGITEIDTSSSRSQSLHPRPNGASNQQQQLANNDQNLQHITCVDSVIPSHSGPSPQLSTTSGQNQQPTTRSDVILPSAPTDGLVYSSITNTDNRSWEQRCSICSEPFTQSIYQCATGHSVCGACRERGLICAICHSGVLEMRNFALEEHLTNVRNTAYPCQNAGCKFNLRREDMELHLKECIFRNMECPLNHAMSSRFGFCYWKGRRGDDMLRHFNEAHRFMRRVNVNSEIKLRLQARDNLRHVNLVVLEQYFFFIHIKVFEQTMSVAVQLLGTKNGAGKWKYEIHMYNKAEPRRKLTYSDDVTADGDVIDRVFTETRCLNVPCAYVYRLCESGELTYKVFITKQDQHGNEKRVRGPRAANTRNSYQNRQHYNA